MRPSLARLRHPWQLSNEIVKGHFIFSVDHHESLKSFYTFIQTTLFNIVVGSTKESPYVLMFFLRSTHILAGKYVDLFPSDICKMLLIGHLNIMVKRRRAKRSSTTCIA